MRLAWASRSLGQLGNRAEPKAETLGSQLHRQLARVGVLEPMGVNALLIPALRARRGMRART